jgi:hypothetical protein
VALSGLVASGRGGLDQRTLSEIRLALNMSGSPNSNHQMMRRLRGHWEHAFPKASAGRYRLSVDVDDVDVWWLLAVSQNLPDDFDPGRLVHVLNPDPLYRGLENIGVVNASKHEILRARRDLVVLILEHRPELLQGELVPCLEAVLDEHPGNEKVVEALARAMVSRGDRRAALRVINRAQHELVHSGLELKRSLKDLEVQLFEAEDQPERPDALALDQPEPLPPSLARLRSDPLIGPPAALAMLTDGLSVEQGDHWFLVTGPPGIGKRRLSAELAASAVERGMVVVHLSPTTRNAPWDPFTSALDLYRDRTRLLTSDALEDVTRVRFDDIARQALEARAADRPMVLVVTDGQYLDHFSADLLTSLAHRSLSVPLIVLLSGDDRRSPRHPVSLGGSWRDPGAMPSPWLDLLNTIQPTTGSLTRADLDSFDHDMMTALVRRHRPDFSDPTAHQLADRLVLATQGRPGIAIPVLRALDDHGVLSDPSTMSPEELLGGAVDRLPDTARRVGAASAVLGPHLGLDDLAALFPGVGTMKLLEDIDVLLDRGFLDELPGAGLRINVLCSEALMRPVSKSRLRTWNEQAAERFRHDPHRLARHLRLAGGGHRAVDALLRSAQAYLGEGLYVEASGDYRWASILLGCPLEPADAGSWARALDLSGLHEAAIRVRQQAFEDVVDDDGELALDIALSSQPEAERLEGMEELVGNLQRIDVAHLSGASRHRRACALARQMTLLGRQDEAGRWASLARSAAGTPAERVSAAITERLVLSAWSNPVPRIKVLEVVAADVVSLDTDQQAEYLVHMAVDCYQACLPDRLSETRKQLRATLDGSGPRRRWHAMLLEATLAFDRGELSEARQLRRQAADFGASFGIAEALSAGLAGAFVEHWLAGTVGDLAIQVDREQLALVDHWSTLAEVANAMVLRALGQQEQAEQSAVEIAAGVLARRTLQASPALAALSTLLVESGRLDLIDGARQTLRERGSSMLLVGGFAATLGPAPRYVADLTPPGPERTHLRRLAIDVAAKARSQAWTEITEQELDDDT